MFVLRAAEALGEALDGRESLAVVGECADQLFEERCIVGALSP